MKYLLFSAIGAIGGSVLTSIIFRLKSATGTLLIDHSNAEKDVYRFDIDNLDNLSKKKHIILRVDNNADLSQK